ncbi:regulator of g protein signaling [Anaeramoeba flamelloides]|uniref:Regulator of g protein signaling n=1 Tax=Anaeramoeba flamelloides TaxID=1746091 RepID=A0ABQ8XRB2_9EUKA|nr:regulator of g protein signaling [Anaeramoeba flamelloides]
MGIAYNISWWLYSIKEENKRCFIYYYSFQVFPNMFYVVYVGTGIRLRYIFKGNSKITQERFQPENKNFQEYQNNFLIESENENKNDNFEENENKNKNKNKNKNLNENENENQNQNGNKNENKNKKGKKNEEGAQIGSDNSSQQSGSKKLYDDENIEIYQKEQIEKVERNFFSYQSRVSERMLFQILTVLFLLFSILVIILYFCTRLKSMKDCIRMDSRIENLPFNILFGLFTILWFIVLFAIKEIKDNYFIRIEIYIVFFFSVLYIPVNLYGANTTNFKIMIISTNIYQFIVALIFLGIPVIETYRRQRLIRAANSKSNDALNPDDNINQEAFCEFTKIINDPNNFQYWVSFTQLNYTVENIMFYRLHLLFKKQKSKRKRIKISKQIINNFFLTSSSLQINIGSETRRSTIDLYLADPSNILLFDDAIQKICNLMYYNSYPLFVRSKIYQEMLIQENYVDPLKYQNEKDSYNTNEDDINNIYTQNTVYFDIQMKNQNNSRLKSISSEL